MPIGKMFLERPQRKRLEEEKAERERLERQRLELERQGLELQKLHKRQETEEEIYEQQCEQAMSRDEGDAWTRAVIARFGDDWFLTRAQGRYGGLCVGLPIRCGDGVVRLWELGGIDKLEVACDAEGEDGAWAEWRENFLRLHLPAGDETGSDE